ncbi:MAG: recombinase family protein [Pseudomonadota bacterium]
MKQYVVYTRVSTKDQGRSGLGLEAQRRDIDLFLANYSPEPWEIVADFKDVVSGASSDRPQLEAAIEKAKATGAELLVSKLDRLSRKVSFIAALMEEKKLNLRVATMPQADKFQLHIYAALAEQERDFISTRTKAALQAAKKRGTKLGGLRDATGRRNEAVKARAEADAVRFMKIIGPLQKGGQSLNAIAATLNEMGLETSRNGRWTAKQVSRIVARSVEGGRSTMEI